MRFVTVSRQGDGSVALELNYMWLPTWLGVNLEFQKSLESELQSKVAGLTLTEDSLNHVHDMVVDYILAKYPLEGLHDYLDGIKFVNA